MIDTQKIASLLEIPPVSLKCTVGPVSAGMHMDEEENLPEAIPAPLVVEFTEEEVDTLDVD